VRSSTWTAIWQPAGSSPAPNASTPADDLYTYRDGAAEGYLLYGFSRMEGIDCKSGANTLQIDVSEMSDADAAYGIFTANRDLRKPTVKIGMGGQVQSQSAAFAKDKYYIEIVEVAANSASDDSAMLQALAVRIEGYIQGRNTPPEELAWFPAENLVSAGLIPQSVLGLRQLQRGYVAKYKQGQAFLVPETSPEAAADVIKALRARFDGASPAQAGDEAFQANARYLNGICIFRKGHYVGGYANLAQAADAAVLAAQLAARIP